MHRSMKAILAAGVMAVAAPAMAAPFDPLAGHTFIYDSSLDAATGYNLAANAFVSHAQATGFRPPTGGTIAGGNLTLGQNGSAVLDLLDAAVVGAGFSVGTDTVAVYGRMTMGTGSTQSSAIFSFGNPEAFDAAPTPADVEIVSGYARSNSGGSSSSNLLAWGQKRDFNNPGDTAAPNGRQATIGAPTFPASGDTVDFALLLQGNQAFAYYKQDDSTTWLQAGPAADLTFAFDADELVIYNPTNGTTVISDIAISVPGQDNGNGAPAVPEPMSAGLALIGLAGLAMRRRKA